MKLARFLTIILSVMMVFTSISVTLGFDWGFLWNQKLDKAKIASGLKEALQIGTEKSVNQAGQVDGFYKNPAIKILLPDKIQKVEKILRQLGLGTQVDEFVLSLNRAAERATPAAKEIFWSAIKEMAFDDVITIFKGNNTAATDYFEAKTREKLKTAFTPVINQATDEVDATRIYKKLALEINKIKFLKLEPVDIDEYVTTKTLDGLFHVLGEEETKIRQNPAARVTELLKQVFGQ